MNDPQPTQVKEYWEKIAHTFDTIYSGEKSAFSRWLDRVFRKDMYDRLRLTLEVCGADDIHSILDVGTGSGRFCIPLAAGKERVLGVDFSEPMIELARQHAAENGVESKCRFEVGDFLEMDFDEPFDAIMAIGLFDYIRRPDVFLAKMNAVAGRVVVATFPRFWTWRAPVRWIRLNLQGCPVYFFRESQIRKYYETAGMRIERLEFVGKIFFVVSTPSGAKDDSRADD